MDHLSGIIFEAKSKQEVTIAHAPKQYPPPVIVAPIQQTQLFVAQETSLKKTLPRLKSFALTFSSGLIAVSLFGFIFLFWPVFVQEIRYRLIASHQSTAQQNISSSFPTGEEWVPANTTFSIIIPKIDAKAPIIANIDSADEKAYMEALKKGVVHAKGTCFPGMECRMYLFAHSAGSAIIATRYNAVFYLLRKLEKGDTFIVYYYGKKFLYEVTGKEIASPEDVHYIADPGNVEELVLQTCDPPGTTKNRLLVFAKPMLVEYLR